MTEHPENIIFFDGVCNLCSHTIDFILRNNRKKSLYYASLQSSFARDFFKEQEVSLLDLNTLYYYQGGHLYVKSTAVLMIMKEMKGVYPLFSVLLIIPPCVRDLFYSIIARTRYTLFGKKDHCRIPTDEEKPFFIG